MEALNVRIGADISDLQQAGNKSQAVFTDIAKSAARAQTSLNSISTASTSTSKSLASTAVAAASLDSKLATVSKGVGKSKTNFTDLSRVIQDLPYGFNGIANNLTQLIPGVGAAGLAFSALVTAVTFASVGFGAWTRMLGGNKDALEAQKEAAKKAKEETQAFKDSLDGARSGAISTGLSLKAFVDIARDGNKPLSERNEALREANKILGDHGDKLTLVNINTKAVTETVNKFTEALVQQAVAAKYADRIADLTIKQTQAAKEYNKEVAILNAGFTKNKQLVKDAGGFANVDIFKLSDTGAQAAKARTALNGYNAITGEINDTTKDFNQALDQSVTGFGNIGHKTKETGAHLKTAKDIVSELEKELRGLNGELEGSFIDEDQFDKGLISAYQKAIKSLNEINAPASQISELQLQVNPVIEAEEFRKRLAEAIKEKVSTVSPGKQTLNEVEISANIKPVINTDFIVNQDEFNKKLADTQKIAETLSPLFDNIFKSIESGENVFQSIGSSVRGLAIQLAEAAIKAAIFSVILNAFTGGAGRGFDFKSLFASFSGLPKFAGGVTGFSGGAALVGESGPELVRLPQGSNVIPNHRLNEVAGSGTQVFIPNIVFRGSDMLIQFNRAQNQSNRRG